MGRRGKFYWQMNLFMLREILYRETYDKSISEYTENPGKWGGRKEIHENARSENPPNCALGRLSWAEDFEVSGPYQLLSNQDGIPAERLGCLPR